MGISYPVLKVFCDVWHCQHNEEKKCIRPSSILISEEGKCRGYVYRDGKHCGKMIAQESIGMLKRQLKGMG